MFVEIAVEEKCEPLKTHAETLRNPTIRWSALLSSLLVSNHRRVWSSYYHGHARILATEEKLQNSISLLFKGKHSCFCVRRATDVSVDAKAEVSMERFVSGHALLRVSLLATLSVAIISATQASFPGIARAGVSQSWHQLPWSGKVGVTPSARCANASPGYACTLGGYGAWIAHPSGWAWQYYGGSNPSYNALRPAQLHALRRLPTPRKWRHVELERHGSAWATSAANHGASVNQTPTVGSVAQWNVGHVAYVEAVHVKIYPDHGR